MQHCLLTRWVALVAAVVWALAGAAASAQEAAGDVEPVVPGYFRLRDEATDVNPAELGQLLIGELNCTTCHAAPDAKRVEPKGAPDLTNIGARVTPQWIKAYLS